MSPVNTPHCSAALPHNQLTILGSSSRDTFCRSVSGLQRADRLGCSLHCQVVLPGDTLPAPTLDTQLWAEDVGVFSGVSTATFAINPLTSTSEVTAHIYKHCLLCNHESAFIPKWLKRSTASDIYHHSQTTAYQQQVLTVWLCLGILFDLGKHRDLDSHNCLANIPTYLFCANDFNYLKNNSRLIYTFRMDTNSAVQGESPVHPQPSLASVIIATAAINRLTTDVNMGRDRLLSQWTYTVIFLLRKTVSAFNCFLCSILLPILSGYSCVSLCDPVLFTNNEANPITLSVCSFIEKVFIHQFLLLLVDKAQGRNLQAVTARHTGVRAIMLKYECVYTCPYSAQTHTSPCITLNIVFQCVPMHAGRHMFFVLVVANEILHFRLHLDVWCGSRHAVRSAAARRGTLGSLIRLDGTAGRRQATGEP